MTFASYLEYIVYLGVVFGGGFVVGRFWDRVTGGKDDV